MNPTNEQTSLSPNDTAKVTDALQEANRAFMRHYPGESNRRQAVHTVYGGAHLFKANSPARLGAVALRSLEEYAPDAQTLAESLGVRGDGRLWQLIYERIVEKLRREPVEDFRLDFEDGYGNRADEEEDGHAATAAAEVARGLNEGSLPPFLGIRIKPLNEDLRARSVRTLDIFISALMKATNGRLPPNFVITVPKVQLPAQMTAAAEVVRGEDMDHAVRISSDLEQHTRWLQRDLQRGFDGLFLHEVGPDQERFVEAFGREVLPHLR